MSDNRGGPVNSEASFFRDTGAFSFYVKEGVECPTCSGNECYMPMQTAVLPNIAKCLRCGTVEPVKEFKFA